MAAIIEGQQYALSSQYANKGQSMVFVKLTDSALKAIEDYAAAVSKVCSSFIFIVLRSLVLYGHYHRLSGATFVRHVFTFPCFVFLVCLSMISLVTYLEFISFQFEYVYVINHYCSSSLISCSNIVYSLKLNIL